MRWQVVGWVAVCALAAVVLAPAGAQGQFVPAGVVVDAQGVLHKQVVRDPDGSLTRQRAAAALATLDRDVAAVSPDRKISLTRLEAQLRRQQGVPTEAMRYLAGLQRVRYVFYYPETKDIVIAGPAQGWMTDLTGRVVGLKNGRPTLQLQDLVVALRAFGPDGKETPEIGCSIDPTPEGLAAFQQFQRRMVVEYQRRGPARTLPFIVEGSRETLGMHNVTVTGVSPNTHFAQVLVEADYRMKLIGIGLEQPPIRLASYVDRASPSHAASNALQRWFFTPDYHCVRVGEDGLAMELVGDGVQLVGADEMVAGDGVRRQASRADRASQAFVTGFTKKYPELADRSPVFAELRNLIDLAVAAAFMQQQGYYEKAGWDLGLLGNEKDFAAEVYQAPKQVETIINVVSKGNSVMTPIGGGVHIEPTQALDAENLLEDEGGKVDAARKQVKIQLAEGQWWWD
ncbi:MAG: DUF1598 domain-containing protein [Pirellulales bacterium]|nr:DUF1598 domain-containing protein [Pirellulales bacterium]